MMDYEMFKEIVAEKFRDYLPEEIRNMKMDIRSRDKVNQTLDGISFFDMQADMPHLSPTIYINHMYEDYKSSGDIEGTLRQAANIVSAAMQRAEQMVPKIDMSDAKEKIVFQLINTEQNKKNA